MESWGWPQFLSILPCLVNEFLTFISTNHSLTSSPHWFLLQYSRIPWLAFFPTPKSLTQKCLSYGHPVPYLKFNESTIPFLTILFWFFGHLYHRVQVLNTTEKAPSNPMSIIHPLLPPYLSSPSVSAHPDTPGTLSTSVLSMSTHTHTQSPRLCCSAWHWPTPSATWWIAVCS